MIYAISQTNTRTHILDAIEKDIYRCEHCRDQVIPHQGDIRPWHYVHQENSECIIGDMRGKGCILEIGEVAGRTCQSHDECHRECQYK